MRIEICGALGSGKSTLAATLAEKLGAEKLGEEKMAFDIVREPVENHPFLRAFYADPALHDFEKSVFFLTDYVHQVKKHAHKNAVFDAGQPLHKSYIALSAATDAEKGVYAAFENVIAQLPPAQLIIHLDLPVEVVVERIRNRDRDFEGGVDAGFVGALQEEVARQVALCGVPVLRLTTLDILNHPSQLDQIVAAVKARMPQAPAQKAAPRLT